MAGFFENIVKLIDTYGYLFLQGIGITLALAAVSIVAGSFLGIFVAFGKMSRFRILRGIFGVYIEVLRGTPTLLQLYLFWVLLPYLPGLSRIEDYQCVVIALIVNASAYIAEIIRAGIQAVDEGQREAAVSLGMSERDIMWKVIMPQAIKNILPALGNEFIIMIKETSLASVFTVGEIMTRTKKIYSITFLYLEAITIAGLIYLVLTVCLSRLLKYVERRMNSDE